MGMTDDKKREILAQVGRVNSDICYGCPIIERYLELMSSQPELVRCRDCKHSSYCNVQEIFPGTPDVANCTKTGITHRADWFCADGEKETDV